MVDRLRLALGAGHRHTLGEQGNPFERDLNGRKVHAIMEAWRNSERAQKWLDIRSYTPDDGLGLFPGYLNQAPASLVNSGWRPDVMCELHSEGVRDTSVQGGFVIYPDWGDDVDADVRELGAYFPRALRDATGIGIRWSSFEGRMSEHRTGVGIEGFRLGVFRDTAWARGFCTRLIFEQGAHSNPHDRALMTRTGFLEKQAGAFLSALLEFATAAGIPFAPPSQGVEPMRIPTGGTIGQEWRFGNATWKRVSSYRVAIANGTMVYAGFDDANGRRIPAWQVDDDAGFITRRVTFHQQGGPYLVISGGYMVRENEVARVETQEAA